MAMDMGRTVESASSADATIANIEGFRRPRGTRYPPRAIAIARNAREAAAIRAGKDADQRRGGGVFFKICSTQPVERGHIASVCARQKKRA
jgi:hypothetical protein